MSDERNPASAKEPGFGYWYWDNTVNPPVRRWIYDWRDLFAEVICEVEEA